MYQKSFINKCLCRRESYLHYNVGYINVRVRVHTCPVIIIVGFEKYSSQKSPNFSQLSVLKL